MKKTFPLILILTFVIFIAGCNTDRETASSDSSADTVTEKSEAPTRNEETSAATDSAIATETETESELGGETEIETGSGLDSDTKNETESNLEYETQKDITASCIVKEGDLYVIVLPISGERVPIHSSYTEFLPYVTDESVRAAEAKITEQVNALGETPKWIIGESNGKGLCLIVEVIKFIQGADESGEGGCGIDHEHLFFAESIIGE